MTMPSVAQIYLTRAPRPGDPSWLAGYDRGTPRPDIHASVMRARRDGRSRSELTDRL